MKSRIMLDQIGFRDMKWRKKQEVYFIIYTLSFFLAMLITFNPYFAGHKTFLYKGDGRVQHYQTMVYLGRTIRRTFLGLLHGNFSIPMFDLNVGLGSDIIGFLNSLAYTDPLTLIVGLFPTKLSEYVFAFLVFTRIYLAGLSFSYLGFYFKKKTSYILIGSLVYCFCGYAIGCSMRHPYFVNPMYLLPVLIVGTEKILRKERPYTLVFGIFYSALCGYYHLYMMTIMIVLYAAVRFFDLYQERRVKEFGKAVGRGAGAYCLGIGLAALPFFPSVAAFLNASREGHSVYIPNKYSWGFFRNHFMRLIAPSASSGWSYPAFAAITLFAFVLLIFSKGRRTLKVLLGTALAVWLTGFGNYVMNGFQYPSERWSFGLALLSAFILVEMLPDLMNLSGRQKVECFAVICLYGIFTYASSDGRRLTYGAVGFSFLAVTLLILLMIHQCSINLKIPFVVGDEEGLNIEILTGDKLKTIVCIILVIVNVGVNGIYTFAPDQGNIVSRNSNFGDEIKRLETLPERLLSPYLLKNPSGRMDGRAFSCNAAMVWNLPGMLTYSSVTNESVTNFFDKMENCGNSSEYDIYSTDQRTIVNTLLSEKYHVEKDTPEYVPYGYSPIKTKGDYTIYSNDYALPWGYTYDKTISYDELDAMNGLEKQEAMLQAVAIDVPGGAGEYSAEIVYDEQQLSYTAEYKDCTWKEGKLVVSKDNALIKLHFDMPEDVEGYVRLSAMDFNESGLASMQVRVGDKNVSKTVTMISANSGFYFGRENYLFNLGYSEEPRSELTIVFTKKGTFQLDDIELFALPIDNYPKRVEALREEPLENIQWDINSLNGTVDLSRDKILCVSIPYSEGWTATVDGEKAEILQGNYFFMCIPLTAGFHNVEFHYCSPGIKIGAIVSLGSLCIVIWMLFHDWKRKNATESALILRGRESEKKLDFIDCD